MDDTTTVTAGELGTLLGLTDRRIRQLAAEGIIVKASRNQYALGASLRNMLTAVEGKAEPDDLRLARLELMRSQKRRIDQDIAEKESTGADLAWQSGLVDAFATFYALRLRSAAAWFHTEYANRHVTVRGVKGDAARHVAGWIQETALGLAHEVRTELGKIVLDAEKRGVILNWDSMVRHAEREDLPDDDNG
jgi:hypothetical protein